MIATIEDLKLEQFLRNRNSGKLVWKTKEGRIIPLKELSDEHLTNILNVYSLNKDQTTNIKPSSLNFYQEYKIQIINLGIIFPECRDGGMVDTGDFSK